MKTMPIRRDVKTLIDWNQVANWHGGGPVVTHFFNSLSVLFPHGERYFMDSLRAYRDKIDCPEQQAIITAFIGQEAMHSREHIDYNKAISTAGFPARKWHDRIGRLLDTAKAKLPRRANLAATCALEHYTATLANLFLNNPDFQGKNSDQSFKRIWTWHAMEEVEHKCVSYDVWQTVSKPGAREYVARTSTMLLTSLVFWSVVAAIHTEFVLADKTLKGRKLQGYKNLGKILFASKNGPDLKHLAKDLALYFHPDFHPLWQDDTEVLKNIEERVDSLFEGQVKRAEPKAKPSKKGAVPA